MPDRTLPATPVTGGNPDRPVARAPIGSECYTTPDNAPRATMVWEGFTRAETVALSHRAVSRDLGLSVDTTPWGAPVEGDPDRGTPWGTGDLTMADGAGVVPRAGCTCRECGHGRLALSARLPEVPDTPATLTGETPEYGPHPVPTRTVEGVQLPDGVEPAPVYRCATAPVLAFAPYGEVAAHLATLRREARTLTEEVTRLRREARTMDPEVAVDRALSAAGLDSAEVSVECDGAGTVTVTVEGARLDSDGDFAPVERDYRVAIAFPAHLSAAVGHPDASEAVDALGEHLGVDLSEGGHFTMDVEGWETDCTVTGTYVEAHPEVEGVGVWLAHVTVDAVTHHECTEGDPEAAEESAASECCATDGKQYTEVGGLPGATATVTEYPTYTAEEV